MAEIIKTDNCETSKRCSDCGEHKERDQFSRRASSKDGLSTICKVCAKKRFADWREKNKERCSQYQKEYYAKTRDERLDDKRQYYKGNVESIKEYRKTYASSKKGKAARKAYYEANKDKILRYNQERRKKRLTESVSYRIAHSTRNRIQQCIGAKKKGKLSRLDWSIPELVTHLERQFTKQMTWDNYGTYWHIDHILPVASFDHTDEAQFKACWGLPNLRRLRRRLISRKAQRCRLCYE